MMIVIIVIVFYEPELYVDGHESKSVISNVPLCYTCYILTVIWKATFITESLPSKSSKKKKV